MSTTVLARYSAVRAEYLALLNARCVGCGHVLSLHLDGACIGQHCKPLYSGAASAPCNCRRFIDQDWGWVDED